MERLQRKGEGASRVVVDEGKKVELVPIDVLVQHEVHVGDEGQPEDNEEESPIDMGRRESGLTGGRFRRHSGRNAGRAYRSSVAARRSASNGDRCGCSALACERCS